MTFEENIFKKSIPIKEKLIEYGFTYKSNEYTYDLDILDNTFNLIITIKDNKVSTKVIDKSFDEEYINYRNEQLFGGFVSTIREEIINILTNIKNTCFSESLFIYPQSNRVAEFIKNNYNDEPVFPWASAPGHGVFKNKDKWYSVIMHINRNKLDEINQDIEILNIKVNTSKLKEILNKKSIYKAYHMNKDNWISIILDDTLNDDEIFELIKESHKFTETSNIWIIPANPTYYDIESCFDYTDTVTWKQSNNINVNDIVYLYVTNPIKEVLYKCIVTKSDIPYTYQDSFIRINKLMNLKLLKKYNNHELTFKTLSSNGVTAIRGPRTITLELKKYIDYIDNYNDIFK